MPPDAKNSIPGYWMHETSGVLKRPVQRYLEHKELSPEDIAALRAYIRQWINSSGWDENPHGTAELASLRDMVASLTSEKQIRLWSKRALEQGIDPW